MPELELPDQPVVAWRESRSPWWALGLLVFLEGFEVRRELSLSRNGITTGNRFLAWEEISAIVGGDGRDLASIRLRNGDVVRLDRWHLPFLHARRAKRERLEVLRRAFVASRGGG